MTKAKNLLFLSMLLAGSSYAANVPFAELTEKTKGDFSIYGNSELGYGQFSISSRSNYSDIFLPFSFTELITGIAITIQPGQVHFAFDSGLAFTFTTGPNGPNISISLPQAPAPVPVPASAWLLGSGLAGLACISRRVRHNAVT